MVISPEVLGHVVVSYVAVLEWRHASCIPPGTVSFLRSPRSCTLYNVQRTPARWQASCCRMLVLGIVVEPISVHFEGRGDTSIATLDMSDYCFLGGVALFSQTIP